MFGTARWRGVAALAVLSAVLGNGPVASAHTEGRPLVMDTRDGVVVVGSDNVGAGGFSICGGTVPLGPNSCSTGSHDQFGLSHGVWSVPANYTGILESRLVSSLGTRRFFTWWRNGALETTCSTGPFPPFYYEPNPIFSHSGFSYLYVPRTSTATCPGTLTLTAGGLITGNWNVYINHG